MAYLSLLWCRTALGPIIIFVCVHEIGPSGVRALPLAAGINKGGHYFRYFGPSGVRALPLAAGINEGGHYFRYFFLFLLFFLLPPIFKTTEGVVVGLKILRKKLNSDPHPLAPRGDF